MAPAAGSPGKPTNSAARPPNRAIVPVLPLNYPQRPANRQPSVLPAAPAPAESQNGLGHAEERRGSQVPKALNGNSTELGPSSSSTADATTTTAFAAPVQAIAKAEPSRNATAQPERATDTAPVSSNFARRHQVSPTRHRPPGFRNPASEVTVTSGPAFEGHMPTPHTAAMTRPTFHQPHPSNGSLLLGGFHDSNTSSPAPRSGGSAFAPPGMLPYPPPPVDGYGRPILHSAVDGHVPPNLINSHHGPPTPHSYHGSQSSVLAEEQGFGHYPAANGHAAYPVDPAGQGPLPLPGMDAPLNGAMRPAAGPITGFQGLRDQDEALSFLRHGISDETFSDCVLEVRFPDTPEFHEHPNYRQLHRVLRTPGHRFLFSRSPLLAGIMKTQRTMPGGVVSLEVADEYIRSDVFWYSLRTLYGWSLADGILPTELLLRDARDDLKTALSYVATARYLQLPWVHSVAVHRASRLLFWNTIETAVHFVSKVVALSPRNDGFGVLELLDQVLAFIVHNFPADFILDTSADDHVFPRLPPSSPSPPRNNNPDAPAIAHGGTPTRVHSRQSSKSQIQNQTQTQMPRNPRFSSNLRLSQIKFGDISPSKNGHHALPATPALDSADNSPATTTSSSPPRSSHTPNDTILSRILLNLPFELLKQILEHPHLAKLSGDDLAPAARQRVITEIVAEREARRVRVLERAAAAAEGEDSVLRGYLERVESLSGPPPPPVVAGGGSGSVEEYWVGNLGFKEEVFVGDLPYLVHTWGQAPSSGVSS